MVRIQRWVIVLGGAAAAAVAGGLYFTLPLVFAQQVELPERARALDTNGNGVIDRDEARGPLKENFDTADTNGDGAIDGAELAAMFAGGGGRPPGGAQARAPAEDAGPPSTELSDRAKALDTNGNGVIDKSEAQGPLASSFDAIDKDDSGGIDGAEMAAFFGGGAGGAAVEVDVVADQELDQTIPVIGRLVARQNGPVAARVSGPVEEIRIEVGDRVRRGDVLVVIAHDRFQSATDRQLAVVEQRQAGLAIAIAEQQKTAQEMERIEQLRAGPAFSQKRYDDMSQEMAIKAGTVADRKAQLAQAIELLNYANIDLRDAVIRAPYDGVVTERNVEVGAYATASSTVVRMINDSDIDIEVDVPSNRLAGLEIGTALDIVLDDGTAHRATVRALIPVENPLTRTRPVRLTPQFGTTIRAPALNQSVTVAVPIGAAGRVLTVHKDAVVRPEGEATVFVIDGRAVQPRKVVLGASVGQRFIVLAGLEAGERVVTRGNEQLRAGQQVRIVSAN